MGYGRGHCNVGAFSRCSDTTDLSDRIFVPAFPHDPIALG